jgi:hypothetical protein
MKKDISVFSSYVAVTRVVVDSAWEKGYFWKPDNFRTEKNLLWVLITMK